MTAVIGKSGTGIGKSGTGIGKSGTGMALGGALSLVLTMLVLLAVPVQSLAGSNLMVTEHGNRIMLSLHAGDQVVVGSVSRSDLDRGYHAFALHSALEFSEGDTGFRTLIKGSGSGSSGASDCAGDIGLLIKGSGSGASGQSACDQGASLLIKGSGSGASGQSACDQGASLLIKGSGSGASGQSVPDQGAGLMIKGSGSGAAGESTGGCQLPETTWGVAEAIIDQGSIQLLIHRVGKQGLEEFMVASIEVAASEVRKGHHHADFVLSP